MKKLFTLLLILLGVFALNAQPEYRSERPADLVSAKKRAGISFEAAKPFERTVSLAHKRPDLDLPVESGTILRLLPAELNNLYAQRAEALSLQLPVDAHSQIVLELVQVQPFSSDFRVSTDKTAPAIVTLDMGLHYRGVVKDAPNTQVAISIFSQDIMGLIIVDGNRFALGKLPQSAASEYILYEEKDLDDYPALSCATPDDGQGYERHELEDNNVAFRQDKCVRLYMEVNNDVFNNKGGLQNTINYVTGIFNQSAILFANESLNFVISEIFVWTGPSPYTQNSTSQLLTAFQNNSSNFNGDLAILLSYRGSGGIAAGFNGLCNSNRRNSMCYAGIASTFNNVPVYSWTVMVFTHEIGHLLGSRHTHACVWNGNNTVIDGCSSPEGTCARGSIPAQGGTIMSYCHLQSVGINFNLGFGPQPGNVIRNRVASAACLSACTSEPDPEPVDFCSNGVKDRGEEGVDCGGICPPCAPTCSDGIQNGQETGVDCGGPDCPPCASSCATPDGLFSSNIAFANARLNWSAVAGAVSYGVRYRIVGSSGWTTTNAFGTSTNIGRLAVGATYEWEVRSNCSGNNSSDWSYTCTFVAGQNNSGACQSSLTTADNLVQVFPNPANTRLEIRVNNITSIQPLQVQLTDLSGRVMRLVRMDATNTTIPMDVSALTPGVYIVKVFNEEVSYLTRVVIQR